MEPFQPLISLIYRLETTGDSQTNTCVVAIDLTFFYCQLAPGSIPYLFPSSLDGVEGWGFPSASSPQAFSVLKNRIIGRVVNADYT
jgi:hypothetical protein